MQPTNFELFLEKHLLHQITSISQTLTTKMSLKIPVTEVCIIYLKDAYELKDPSTPEGVIWAKSIEALKKCEGFQDIYTSLVVEDPKQALMFISKLPLIPPIPHHPTPATHTHPSRTTLNPPPLHSPISPH
jgi:hypothetical protein